MGRLFFLLMVSLLASACAQLPSSQPAQSTTASDLGVMVMAHGGGEEWNAGVLNVVEPLKDNYNIEVAFGMADAYSLQETVSTLEASGAKRIVVVRLFVSGESWYERTQQILGLQEGAPERAEAPMGMQMPGMRMEFWQLESDASFAMSLEGLSEAEEMDQILLERALNLSENPAVEDVLILAHGPGDDDENERWLANIGSRAELLETESPFRRVKVATLREDWMDKREEAEREIRAFVENASNQNGRAIVLPYRVQGFGPYATVLEGLDYRADGQGLVPHPAVTQWIEGQILEMAQGEFSAGH
ncbi:MAG: hypothetical protein COA71_13815 [SAR86 cluster bacterium]|uniref:Cobalamin biosynthesis protein CbiX n=1 Tax=SAR86 cluster bacterium TaxID=2030880 RepID=A0A2A5C6K9_9GAMM|nr:MAG: hypothetical protein COA71_13815 [SAR86 cluster bacterium]